MGRARVFRETRRDNAGELYKHSGMGQNARGDTMHARWQIVGYGQRTVGNGKVWKKGRVFG